jgi:hypothetical protein
LRKFILEMVIFQGRVLLKNDVDCFV